MAFIRNFLLVAALIGAPLGGVSADVPTKLDELGPTEKTSSDAEAEKAIRQLRDLMFPAGERVEDWDVGGADPEKAVRAMGADKYYLLETDASDGTSVVSILTGRPISDIAPAGWRAIKSYGDAGTQLANPSVAFGYLTQRFVLAGRANGIRMRDADCSNKVGHAILYEVPGAPEAPEDKDIPDMFDGLMLAIGGQTLCARFDGDREKGFSVRYFLPDGRQLLNPDRSVPDGRVAIVPAAPIDSLIKPPPPSSATPQP
ncbi:MAG TPA: hypothetical protein VIT45_03425 [Allosphingosinicella sp.]